MYLVIAYVLIGAAIDFILIDAKPRPFGRFVVVMCWPLWLVFVLIAQLIEEMELK